MKRSSVLVFLMLFSGCLSLDHRSERVHYIAPHSELYYDDACYYNNPYLYEPAYCEERWSEHVGEFICCGWQVNQCYYEEWCIWHNSCGWQYNEKYKY